ncbi:MAG TPA: GNAT family N-acetyltransferase [Candidatus Polarisedimenticolia bacterium]|nr:GNAT family N-acetyltransferase [Candidatus Polarisedimenticolia bacterium]
MNDVTGTITDPPGGPLVEAARPEDLPAIEALLAECGLPVEGVAGLPGRFVIVRSGGRMVGCAGVEIYGEACVLRSLAVSPAWRGRCVARPLIDAILAEARRAGCREAYLLTFTVEKLAARRGFERVERGAVPAALLDSVEFRLHACGTAAVMRIAFD